MSVRADRPVGRTNRRAIATGDRILRKGSRGEGVVGLKRELRAPYWRAGESRT